MRVVQSWHKQTRLIRTLDCRARFIWQGRWKRHSIWRLNSSNHTVSDKYISRCAPAVTGNERSSHNEGFRHTCVLSLLCQLNYTHTMFLSLAHSLTHSHTHTYTLTLTHTHFISQLSPNAAIKIKYFDGSEEKELVLSIITVK